MFFSQQYPSFVSKPELVLINDSLLKELGLNEKVLNSDDGLNIFAGNYSPEGASNISQAYAGHQYGHFTMLGDGRAVLVGEHITKDNEKFDIQLKGSGRTPYSRGGDGRAALGPMLREYIISEAMKALNIPTTRSLAVVKTGNTIIRNEHEDGAVLTRIASSHIRVGTFQYAAKYGDIEEMEALADYTINRHFKDLEDKPDKYRLFLREVVKRQGELIAKWQLVGFIHGVMNTDNMSICGETIDYGPCAFMDIYDEDTVFSSIDHYGRYAYKNQPNIAAWNLARFAESILPLINRDINIAVEIAQEEIMKFEEVFKVAWTNGMRNKLGIFNKEDGDKELFEDLLKIMGRYKADYTNTFRELTLGEKNSSLFNTEAFKEWDKKWKNRLERQSEGEVEVKELMKKSNPSIIPRNHKVEEALNAAKYRSDFTLVKKLIKALSNPYDYEVDKEFVEVTNKNEDYKTFCGT